MVAILPRAGKYNWRFQTVPQPGLNGRRGYQARSRGLGADRRPSMRWPTCAATAPTSTTGPPPATPAGPMTRCCPTSRGPRATACTAARCTGATGRSARKTCAATTPSRSASSTPAALAGVPFNPDINGESQDGACRFQVTQHRGERLPAPRRGARQPARDHRGARDPRRHRARTRHGRRVPARRHASDRAPVPR